MQRAQQQQSILQGLLELRYLLSFPPAERSSALLWSLKPWLCERKINTWTAAKIQLELHILCALAR